MSETLIGVLVAVSAFIVGFIFSGRRSSGHRIEEQMRDAERTQKEGERAAADKYKERMEKAEEQASEIVDRPVSGDPVVDLLDRLQRHRERNGGGSG